MSHGDLPFRYILNEFSGNLDGKTVLNIGTGYGMDVYMLCSSSGNTHIKYIGQPIVTAIEINKNCCEWLRKQSFIKSIYNLDFTTIEDNHEVFNKKYDYIMVIQSLEHMEKNINSLEKFKKLGNNVVISVTYGYVKNKRAIKEFNHVSEWYPNDFKKHGYKVKVVSLLPKYIGIFIRLYLTIRMMDLNKMNYKKWIIASWRKDIG